MKTTIHTYNLNTSKPDERAAYEKLCAELTATPGRGRWMNSNEASYKERETFNAHFAASDEITLDLEHVFSNQWNATAADGTSVRVFDWYEGINWNNQSIKQGHYLAITDEMREVRRNTNECGYCGRQDAAARGLVFCDRCLGSAHLKATELHMLRMLPVEYDARLRKALTAAECSYIMPLYEAAQQARRVKVIADVRAQHNRKAEQAITERDGMVWLLDHGIDTDNVIYYAHKTESHPHGHFGFGWREVLTFEQVDALLRVVSEFPFPYSIKGREANGNVRTWDGY